ncbi:MAG: hypothetical protein WD875_17845 [Pirellulales bacterium]
MRNPPLLFGIVALAGAVTLHFAAADFDQSTAATAATAEVLLGAMAIVLLLASVLYRKS